MMTRGYVAGLVIGLAFLFLGLVGLARGHGFFDPECCSDRDCYLVADDEITESADGFTIKTTGEFIDRRLAKVRMSPDGRWYRCSYGGDVKAGTICIYVPGRGA